MSAADAAHAHAQPNPRKLEPRYLEKWPAEAINTLPLTRFKGVITFVDDPDGVAPALKGLAGLSLIGFDTETQPCFKKGQRHAPALLQLAAPDRVYIFQLAKCGLPPALVSLLADPAVTKAGVAVRDDCVELNMLCDFDADGFVDLGDAARAAGMQTHGLRNLAANLLGVRISKGERRSNWGKTALTDKQIRYAATDAWISRALAVRMAELKIILL